MLGRIGPCKAPTPGAQWHPTQAVTVEGASPSCRLVDRAREGA